MADITAEALRYLGASQAEAPLVRQVEETLATLPEPRFLWRVFRLEEEAGGVRFVGGPLLPGSLAREMLADCGQGVLLACTLGAGFDRRLRALQARDMAAAAVLDACGSALAEAGCDAAQAQVAARFPFLTDRFSPGYGDLPLTVQPELCAALDTPRRLGLHVTGSLLLNPLKSVTAVTGLADRPQPARIRGCGHCPLRETCTYRKGGTRCGSGL